MKPVNNIMDKKGNVVAKQFKVPMCINLPHYGIAKLALRGVTDLSGLGKLQSELCQTKVGDRVAVEVNGVTLVAERKSENEADLITGWRVGHEGEDISGNAKTLMDMLYKVMFSRMTAFDIRKAM